MSSIANYDSEDDSLSSLPENDFYSCCSDTLDLEFEDLPETVANCLEQLELDCVEHTYTFTPTATKDVKIDLLGALPTHEEIVSELVQALRIGLDSSNGSQSSKSSREPSRSGTPQKLAGKLTQCLKHSDSQSSLWRADMSSASSLDFNDHPTDSWLSEPNLTTSTAIKNLPNRLWITEKSVERRNSVPYLCSPLSPGDVEEGGCSLASFVTKL